MSDTRPWWRAFFDRHYRRVWAPVLGAERTDEEVEALAALLPEQATILDLCGGDGRVARPLSELGHDIVVVDASRDMLQAGLAAPGGATIPAIEGDARTACLQPRFDVVLNLFSSLGLFASDAEHQAMLEAAASALRPGGLLIMDVVHRDFVSSMPPMDTWYRLDDGTVVLRSFAFDPISGRTIESVRWRDGDTELEKAWSSRIFTATEIDRMLQRAGLTPAHWFSGFDLEPFGVDSPRLLVVAARVPTHINAEPSMATKPKNWRDIVDWLRCPATGQPLSLLPESEVDDLNAQIAEGEVVREDGARVSDPIEAGLVCEDGLRVYPVRDDIPTLFAGEAIARERATTS